MSEVFSNARWVALSQGGRVAIQLGGLIILARLLPPADYGLMAMATVVTNFALLLRDLGTSAAIVQRNDLRTETITTAFWLNISIGVLLALILFVFSSAIAVRFGDGALAPVLCALSIVFPLSSLGAVQQALLERRSIFRTLARIEILSSGVGLSLAIVAAIIGAGVYSFVIQAVVTAGLSCIQLWIASGWRPQTRPSLKELQGLINFSGNLTLFNFINYFSRNADGMIVGRYLGAASLGVYSMAYRLMLFPVQNFTWVATRALYPVMSRQQNSPEVIAELYLRTIRLISLVTAPLMAGLVVLREPFVLMVFGPDWSKVPEVLTWMGPTGFIQSIVSSYGTIFMARGRTNIMVALGLFSTFTTVIAFYIGVEYGVVGVAACYFFANLINAFPCMIMTMRTLETPATKLLMALAVPVISAILMALSILTLQKILSFTGAFGLLMNVFFGAVVYWLIVVFVFRQDLKDIRALVRLA